MTTSRAWMANYYLAFYPPAVRFPPSTWLCRLTSFFLQISFPSISMEFSRRKPKLRHMLKPPLPGYGHWSSSNLDLHLLGVVMPWHSLGLTQIVGSVLVWYSSSVCCTDSYLSCFNRSYGLIHFCQGLSSCMQTTASGQITHVCPPPVMQSTNTAMASLEATNVTSLAAFWYDICLIWPGCPATTCCRWSQFWSHLVFVV